MISFPEMMFYAEAEGLLPTKLGRLNAAIKDIKNNYSYETVSILVIEKILNKYNLTLADLSDKELRYVKREISK